MPFRINVSFSKRSSWLFFALVCLHKCFADIGITGPIDYTTATNSPYPFITSQMRYQQVYNASLFGSLATNLYLKQVLFWGASEIWNVPKMQINFSTTTNSADHLSKVFNENVGPDDMV